MDEPAAKHAKEESQPELPAEIPEVQAALYALLLLCCFCYCLKELFHEGQVMLKQQSSPHVQCVTGRAVAWGLWTMQLRCRGCRLLVSALALTSGVMHDCPRRCHLMRTSQPRRCRS